MATKDREALLLQMSADVASLRKSMDRAAGVVNDSTRGMERRAGAAVRAIEDSFGGIRLPKSLAREFESLGQGIGQGLQRASQLSAVALGGISAYAIKLAADAAEIESAFDVAFKGASGSAREFSETLAGKVGRDAVELRENMTRLQLVLTGTGVAADQAATMVERLTAIGVDAGSLFNTSDAEALQKIISGLTGEAEPLKAFGVVINEAAMKAELLRLGFKGNAQEASEAAKSIARANLIIKGLAVAQGDAERTADSAANKTRAMRAEFNKAARELGEQLLPAFTQLAGTATDVLKAFNDLPSGAQAAGLGFLALIAAGGPIAGLMANLSKVIKLARETRAAIIAASTAGAAGGAAGPGGAAAGAALTGAGLAGGVAGTGIGAIVVGGGIAAAKGAEYNRTIAAVDKASDEILAATISGVRKQLTQLDNAASTQPIRERYQRDLAKLVAEQMRRLAGDVAGVNLTSGAPDASVIGGFGLTPEQLRPNGGGGKGKTRKGRNDGPNVIDYHTFVSEDGLADITAKDLSKILGAEFVSTSDWQQQIAERATELRLEMQDNVFWGIRGGLEAGFRDGLPGVLRYFRDSLTAAALDGLAASLTKSMGQGALGRTLSAIFAIPGFAGGTDYAPGGLAWVGERGPELVNLPRGSQVLPNHRLSDLAGLQGAAPVTQISVDLRGAVIWEGEFQRIMNMVDGKLAVGGAIIRSDARASAAQDVRKRQKNRLR